MANRERHNEASELDHMGRSPDIYAANIENCGDCWVTAYLDRQHSAFHGTDPDLGSVMFGDRRSTVSQPSHDGHDDND